MLLDPTRLMVVAVLAQGCRGFTELQQLLRISKGRLYHHLSVLEEHGLVERRYRLSAGDRPRLILCLTGRARATLPEALDRLVELLEKLRGSLR